MLRFLTALAFAAFVSASASCALAEVTDTGPNGFAIVHEKRVTTDPDETFAMLRTPNKWWSAEHSWTGDAENFYMDAQAGGCFCEQIPTEEGASVLQRGSVEHARIVYSYPGRMLRLRGAFGPLQGEALTGTLTIVLTPAEGGTNIRFEYVVGGYMRFAVGDIAPAVDAVIGEQIGRLQMALGPVVEVKTPGGSSEFDSLMREGLDSPSGDRASGRE